MEAVDFGFTPIRLASVVNRLSNKQQRCLGKLCLFVCECGTALEVTGMADFDLQESLPSKWLEREI